MGSSSFFIIKNSAANKLLYLLAPARIVSYIQYNNTTIHQTAKIFIYYYTDNHEPTNKLGKIDFTMTSTNNKNSDDTYKAPELNPEQITPAIVRDNCSNASRVPTVSLAKYESTTIPS